MNFRKNVFLLTSLLLFGLITVSHAQFNEGAKAIGGGLSYTSYKVKNGGANNPEEQSFALNLNGGYFLRNQLEVGLQLGISSEKSKHWGNQESKSNLFSFGPYARLYNSITEVVGVFGEAGMNVGFGGNNNEQKIRSFDIGIRPGIILMVNENIGMEARIGQIAFSRRAFRNGDSGELELSQNSFVAAFDLRTIQFGFRLYLLD